VLHLNSANITYGNFLNALISFLLIAASVYFLVVLPVNTLLARMKLTAPPPATKPCPECLSDIPAAAKRCSHCGQPFLPLPRPKSRRRRGRRLGFVYSMASTV
jgi:large conductance mechanosensitive channel